MKISGCILGIFVFIILVGSNVTAQQKDPEQLDTIIRSLYQLGKLNEISKLYPYNMDDTKFWDYRFRRYEAVFTRPGQGTFSIRYGKKEFVETSGLRYSFKKLINNEIEHLKISPGNVIKIQQIILQAEKRIIKGKSFYILVIKEDIHDEYLEEDVYIDESSDKIDKAYEDESNTWGDNYWDNYEKESYGEDSGDEQKETEPEVIVTEVEVFEEKKVEEIKEEEEEVEVDEEEDEFSDLEKYLSP